MEHFPPPPPPTVPGDPAPPPNLDSIDPFAISEDDDPATVERKLRHVWSVKCRREGKTLRQLWEERRALAEDNEGDNKDDSSNGDDELLAVLTRMVEEQQRSYSRRRTLIVIVTAACTAFLPLLILLPFSANNALGLCYSPSQLESPASHLWHHFAPPSSSLREPALAPSTPALTQWSALASFVRRHPPWEDEALQARLPERYMLLQQAIGHAGQVTMQGRRHEQQHQPGHEWSLSGHLDRHAARLSGMVLERARVRLYLGPTPLRPRGNGTEVVYGGRVMADFEDVVEELDSLLDIAGEELRAMVSLADEWT
ncbi:hypothetical protein Tdes44962_MAKER08137 [Teratosphaeria destructans]|uniref:Uncharacterized protein n=1 Tax=Teratosphaeria destructans TaxID=418781 RepID=A0A9W7SWY1_9PEZI|nr:hypothetical protein Tdes44962_MAKER08137 [Teratosphaeria destructans]